MGTAWGGSGCSGLALCSHTSARSREQRANSSAHSVGREKGMLLINGENLASSGEAGLAPLAPEPQSGRARATGATTRLQGLPRLLRPSSLSLLASFPPRGVQVHSVTAAAAKARPRCWDLGTPSDAGSTGDRSLSYLCWASGDSQPALKWLLL